MISYLSSLTISKTILWCYLIWYLVTVYFYFDPAINLWLTSIGISLIVGVALMLSVEGVASWKKNKWQTFRLFMMPFGVSSFASLIKDQRYFLVFPSDFFRLSISIVACVLFVLLVWLAHLLKQRH